MVIITVRHASGKELTYLSKFEPPFELEAMAKWLPCFPHIGPEQDRKFAPDWAGGYSPTAPFLNPCFYQPIKARTFLPTRGYFKYELSLQDLTSRSAWVLCPLLLFLQSCSWLINGAIIIIIHLLLQPAVKIKPKL